MKNDFVPITAAELETWEVNFKEKIASIAQQLGIDSAEVAATLQLIDGHRTGYAALVNKRAAAKAATSTNDAAEKIALKAVRELAARIKTAKGYTEAMGNELKIIGTDSAIDKSLVKPVLTASVAGGIIVLKFNKNKTSGIHIFSRRGSEKDFGFLAVDTSSPYHDNRPNLVPGQIEKREYKAWHFLDESIIGLESDVVSISI